MGDRCYMRMRVHKDDAELFLKLVEDSWGLPTGLTVENFDGEHVEEEIDGGGTDDRYAMAKAGVRFEGFHMDGADYSAHRFFSDGKRLEEWSCDNDLDPSLFLDRPEGKPPRVLPEAATHLNSYLKEEWETIQAISKSWED